jgi:hypothetical protein
MASDHPNPLPNAQPEVSSVQTTNYRELIITCRRGILTGLVVFLGLIGGETCATTTDRNPSPTYRFSCTVAKPGLTSAGIFDAEGRLVRALWTMKQVESGTVVKGAWNGLDQDDRPVLDGTYTWKVVVNRSIYRNVGTIGNTGQPPTTSGHVPVFLEGIAVDANDGIYTVHDWDEPHYSVIKWSPKDGQAEFHTDNIVGEALLKGIAVEPDGSYAYVSGYADLSDRSKAKFSIWRLKLTDGKTDPAHFDHKVEPFTKEGRCIKVYDGGADFPADATQQDRSLMGVPLISLAVHGDTLYATDSLKGRVLLYDKVSGELKKEIAVPLACGLAVAPDGKIWVGHEHSKVSVFDANGERLGTPIADLKEVRALALRGKVLYVADSTAAQVRVYDLTGAKAKLTKSFGQPARPGDRASERMKNINGMAVDSGGNVIVSDRIGQGGRLQKLTPDFKQLWRQMSLEFSSQAAFGAEDPDLLISAYRNAYKIDRKTASWELLGPARTESHEVKAYFGHYENSYRGPPRVVRLFGNDYFYFSAGDGIAIYRIERSKDPLRGPLLNLVACLAGWNPLPDGTHAEEGWRPENRYLWSWQDDKGDYQPQKEEATIVISPGNPPDWEWPRGPLSVDDKGWIWTTSAHRRPSPIDGPGGETSAIYAIPPQGPNKQGNPYYDWNSAIRVVSGETLRAALNVGREVEATWNLAGHSSDGMVYGLCSTKKPGAAQEGGLHMSGNVLLGFKEKVPGTVEAIPEAAWSVMLPKATVGLCPINGGQGGVLIGGDPWRAGVHHYTKDGLLIGSFQSHPRFGAQPLDWPSGMLDAYLAVNCNRDPRDGLLDVFTEDNMNGRLIWYRVDDSDIETLKGTLVVQSAPREQ